MPPNTYIVIPVVMITFNHQTVTCIVQPRKLGNWATYVYYALVGKSICDQILDNGSKSHMYNADLFPEYFFDALDNFSLEVPTKFWKP